MSNPENQDMNEIKVKKIDESRMRALDLMVAAGFACSLAEARRLVDLRAVRVNDQVVTDALDVVPLQGGEVMRVGRSKVVRVTLDNSLEDLRADPEG